MPLSYALGSMVCGHSAPGCHRVAVGMRLAKHVAAGGVSLLPALPWAVKQWWKKERENKMISLKNFKYTDCPRLGGEQSVNC